MEKWIKVFSTHKMYEAEIVKGVLMENDIPTILMNKQDSSIHFGNYEIMVEHENVINAIKIIQDEIKLG